MRPGETRMCNTTSRPIRAKSFSGNDVDVHHFQMGRNWATSRSLGESCYVYAVAASVGVYWITVSLIPVYNKYFFQKEYYPYPIATAGIQLGVVGLLLTLFNAAKHVLLGRWKGNLDVRHASWIFGPHLAWKLKTVLPIGFLFGLKYGVTNLGLNLVPAPTHLLLQSTDLIWTVLGAWWINGEQVSIIGLICLSGCVAGSFVLSIQVGQNVSAPALPIAVNLLSPILLGLCIATLRSACVELMKRDNRVGGSVSAVELTALKLTISSGVAIILASLFECSKEDSSLTGGIDEQSWLRAFRDLNSSIKLGVLGGSLPILAFQVNCTLLTFLTSSVAVGLVGQLKILPQWIVAALFSPNINTNFHLNRLNIVGAVLTISSAAAFAVQNYIANFRNIVTSSPSFTVEESSDDDSETSGLIGMEILDSPLYGSTSATCQSECKATEVI